MSDLGGFSMHELFRAEVETHCAALTDGLLALERTPGDMSVIAPLMRAPAFCRVPRLPKMMKAASCRRCAKRKR